MHPAGGELINDEWCPDKENWSKPEGSAIPSEQNPLERSIESVLHLKDGINKLHLDMCNKIGLHKSGNYCLKKLKSKSGDKSKDKRVCRFHFGEYDKETKMSTGKDVHPFNPIVTRGEHPRYEGRYDHPRFLQHIKCRLLSWKGNCDTQVIIEHFLLALQNYLTQYACKGAASTEDFIQTYRLLLNDSDESTTVKNLCQRLLLKIVGFVDVPEAAADFINTGGKLVRCTRKFNSVGLSGYRLVDTSRSSNNLTRPNVLDKFLSEERRKSYPDITLYDWAKICKKCKCQCMHVPVFTGARIYPVWPPSEEFSKSTLMCHSKGTWTKIDDLKGDFDTFLEAFGNFLDGNDCPLVIKDLMIEAKEKYDKKQDKESNQNKQRSGTALQNQSQNCSQDSYSSSQSSIVSGQINFRESIFNDINVGEEFNDPNLELPLNTGSDDFDWHHYGQYCVGDTVLPENGEEWIDQVSETALESLYQYNEMLNLPEVNILLANKLQMVTISMILRQILSVAKNENPEQLLLLSVGTAGTGKTHLHNSLHSCNIRSNFNVRKSNIFRTRH